MWTPGQLNKATNLPGPKPSFGLLSWVFETTRRRESLTNRAARASEMAAQEVDRLSDPSATDEERQLRKRSHTTGCLMCCANTLSLLLQVDSRSSKAFAACASCFGTRTGGGSFRSVTWAVRRYIRDCKVG